MLFLTKDLGEEREKLTDGNILSDDSGNHGVVDVNKSEDLFFAILLCKFS
jgi:hypothetical protein